MKNSFVLTSALVFILSVSVFGFFNFIQVEKTPVNNLSFTVADIPKTGTTNTNSKTNPDGSTTVYYPDGSTVQTPAGGGVRGTVITGSDYRDDTTGDGTVRLETNPMVMDPPTGTSVEPKNPLNDKMIDPGPEASVDPSKQTNTTSNTTVSRNDSVGQTQNSAGAGSITGSSGTTLPPVTITTPTSVSFLDKIIPLESFKNLGDDPLNKIFNQLFYLGLIIAVVLAVVMIIRGGIEYMTIDAIASKESGKKRVQAALGGLLLAFSAVLILNTINPNITSLKIVFPGLNKVSEVEIEATILNAVNTYNGVTAAQIEEMRLTGKIPEGISPAGQKILAEALNSIGVMKTGTKDGVSYVDSFFNNTENGNKACAAAVNRMVELATGQPVGGGLSTAAMNDALKTNSRFQLVPGGYSAALPGDIVISPTNSKGTGHVGIVATTGASQIISNSSSKKEVLQNHSATSWDRVYKGKGLETYIYRPL